MGGVDRTPSAKNVNSVHSKILPIACMMQLQKVSKKNIFLIGKSGSLEKVPHQEYQSEDLLQDIVDRHPEMIVGEQINPDDPPRWLVDLKRGRNIRFFRFKQPV